MRSGWTRRALISTSATVFVGLAGCQSPSAAPSDPTTSPETPSCRDRETTADRPPTDGNHPLVMEYPELPDEVARASAIDYATAFEEAYQLNRLASKPSTSNYQVKSVYNRDSNEADGGFVVAFEMGLAWQKDSDGPPLHVDATVPVTYFVSDRMAIRYEDRTDADPRNDDGGEVVACHRSG